MPHHSKNALSAQDWAEAALEAIGRRGIEGVAIEPMARQLGVTKGSFYWHFSNRQALLRSALDLWEARETDDVLARVARETDPRTRIQRLITEVNTSRRASRIYNALSSANEPSLVREYVERVSRRRLDFITDCYADLGLSASRAQQWALQTYSVFLGSLQVRRDLPSQWPAADDPAFADYVRFLMTSLLPPEAQPGPAQTPLAATPADDWPRRTSRS